jgi:serine/threonine protein kinase
VDGTPFGRYQLLDLIGRGGMGEVWRAHDTVTDRVVAIKVLPTQYTDDPMFRQRFRREAHAAARLNSPHVIPIHDYGEIEGRLFVTMRLVEGRDLHAVLTEGPLQPSRAVRIIEQVAKALNAAHRAGLVHRDVKPSNVLLDEDDFAYLIDFGIARAADETRLTGTGNAIGTFQYMAPERLANSPDDARADIYALACVLYECLTGQPPFAGRNMASLVADHLNTPPPQPSDSRPDVPAQFDAIIETGMAKDPDDRYATTLDLSSAAQGALTQPDVSRPVDTDTLAVSGRDGVRKTGQSDVEATMKAEPSWAKAMTDPSSAPTRPAGDVAASSIRRPATPSRSPKSPVASATESGGPSSTSHERSSSVPDWSAKRWLEDHAKASAAGVLALVAVVAVVIVIAVGNQSTSSSAGSSTSRSPTSRTLATPSSASSQSTAPSSIAAPTPTISDPTQRLLSVLPAGAECSASGPNQRSTAERQCQRTGPVNAATFRVYTDAISMNQEFEFQANPGNSSYTSFPCPGMARTPEQWFRRTDPLRPAGRVGCGSIDWTSPPTNYLAFSLDGVYVVGYLQSVPGEPIDAVLQWWVAQYQ